MAKYKGTPLESDYEALQRRRDITKALLGQAVSPYEQQMVSGYAVPAWGEAIGKIAQGYAAGKFGKQADEEEQALSDLFDEEVAARRQKVIDQLQGSDVTTSEYGPIQPVAGDPQGAALTAGADPYLGKNEGFMSVLDAMIKADAVKRGRASRSSYKVVPRRVGDKWRDIEVIDGVPGGFVGDPYEKGASASRISATASTGADLATTTDEASKKYGGGIGDRANDRIEKGFESINQNANLDRVRLAIARGAETGLAEEQLLDLKSLARTFGFESGDVEKMGEQEVIRKVSNEMALRLRNPESGLGLTGNTSNKDLSFLKASVVGLNRTKLGNLKIIDLMQRQNEMNYDVANEQQRIIAENGNVVPANLDSQLMSYIDNYPFFREGEREEIEALLAGTTGEQEEVLSDEDLIKKYRTKR